MAPRSVLSLAAALTLTAAAVLAPTPAASQAPTLTSANGSDTEPTHLLRQPSTAAGLLAFTYGSDVWLTSLEGGEPRRITSTPAVESHPHLSPDGRTIAFTSNRSGTPAVYVVPVEGGRPTRLTWYPSSAYVSGWTPDGERVLYASGRESAPVGYERLWTVRRDGGPSTLLPSPFGHRGSFSADGRRIALDRLSRWDTEWADYRGGQNTPLVILDLDDLSETEIPQGDAGRTSERHPVWMDGTIYFLSDRDWTMNVWAYDPATEELTQITRFEGTDVKWLAGSDGTLVFEREGRLHQLDPAVIARVADASHSSTSHSTTSAPAASTSEPPAGSSAIANARPIEITVRGDFPWAEARWEDVTDGIRTAALSPTAQRALVDARGEVFTIPLEHGDVRNLTRSSDAADRAPVWSPDGARVAWFSDDGSGYQLLIGPQDGGTDMDAEPRRIDIGPSVMAWEPAWSPDGSRIAFVDDDVRIRVVDLASGRTRTVDAGGVNIERGRMGLQWSPDSRWLAYAKTGPNHFRRVHVWSATDGEVRPLTDELADAAWPTWDRDGRHLYFLASTDLALASGWANTSSMTADPTYAAYVTVLRADDPTPFPLRSDEEPAEEEDADSQGDAGDDEPAERDDGDGNGASDAPSPEVRIDFDGVERRALPLPMPVRRYRTLLPGPEGTVFVGESVENASGLTLHRFSLEDREPTVFTEGVQTASVSDDGQKMLFRRGDAWHVVGTERPPEGGAGRLDFTLRTHLDRQAEWRQMFDEAWHYERDFFYDPGLHGADWDVVRERYRPLIPWVRHRADLNYVLDQMNGELSVGHSFVFGGDHPAVDTSRVGLLGADLEAEGGRWRIERIYTYESWNPDLVAPLDVPGVQVEEGQYLVGVNGTELTADMDPYSSLDGTAGVQTVLHLNDRPAMEGHWTETVEPVRSEYGLRQRAWVEDNRRRVDELSGGRLAYVWVPNTGGGGTSSFDRYYFAQQDREGAVIDERFNGGGLLDDYMVDLMSRSLRAAITNEVPDGRPFRLPAGIHGPKVLLINELAGSGGDFFPWAFRQQQVGPLIGTRTWGGLVKSSVHYPLVDGGALTAPDNAVFDPINREWIAENRGVPPDIEVRVDARSAADGRDPQLERGVEEALRLLEAEPVPAVTPPAYSRPHRDPGNGGG